MNQKECMKGILAFISYFILSSLPATILTILNIDYSEWNETSTLLFNLIYEIFIALIIILIFFKSIKNNFKEYFSKPTTYLSKYIKYWFIALGLMYLSNIIIILIAGDIAANEQSVRDMLKDNTILTIILASIVAPILEELIFRLSLYKILKKYSYLFIFVSGIVFGAMHIIGNINNWTDILYIIPYSIPGCIFAYTLIKSDNIFVPISLHFIHNTFSLILQLLAFNL